MNQKEFFTRVIIPETDSKIKEDDALFLTGSCFTEHISEKLNRYKYDIISNPFGILYNPISIARSIERIVARDFYTKDELVFHDGLYHSMDHHGSFSSKDPDLMLDHINDSLQNAHDHLSNCRFAFISPGTSKVYRYKDTNSIVGNCHKVPSKAFLHEQLSAEACTSAFERIYEGIKKLSSGCQIIWTVSPVRHIKDGLIENQKSKAMLILGIMENHKKHPEALYFPAYEIMVDELRDYRYYDRDMLHPSPLAIDIIWNIFEQTYFHEKNIQCHRSLEKIVRATQHRILHHDRQSIATFAHGQLKAIDEFEQQYPDIGLDMERAHFLNLIDNS